MASSRDGVRDADPVLRKFANESAAVAGMNAEAREILQFAMMKRGWGYKELAEALRTMGITRSAAAINRRINRGNFTAGFFLACIVAMRFELDLRELDK